MIEEEFTGYCVLAASGIVAVALDYHAQCGRYQFLLSPPGSIVLLDTFTGDVKGQDGWTTRILK